MYVGRSITALKKISVLIIYLLEIITFTEEILNEKFDFCALNHLT